MASHLRPKSPVISLWILMLLLGAYGGAQDLLAQAIEVNQAIPDNAPQDTVNLNVQIKGKGFKKGAQARWFISGTNDPGGVRVNSTVFVNSTELVANIDVAADAVITQFDIVVALSDGRTGKGIRLFSVTAKGSGTESCVAPTPVLAAPAPDCYLTAAGCLDVSFGSFGLVVTNTSGSEPVETDSDIANAVAIQADGKIVAAGRGLNPDAATREEDFTVVRYNSDGSMDTAFGVGGVVKVAGGTGGAWAVSIQPDDGKIVLAGDGFLIVRLNPDGTLDPNFGNGGMTTVTFTARTGKNRTQIATGTARGLVLQPDGKIVAVGGASTKTIYGSSIARLNPDGSLDSTFDTGGTVYIQDGTEGAGTVILQPVEVGTTTEHRILVGAWKDFALMRFTPSGGLDTTFGPNGTGMVQTDFCSTSDMVRALGLDAAGNILASGFARFSFEEASMAVARYSPNGILDTSFGDPQLTSSGEPTGKTLINLVGPWDLSDGLVPQADGKIVLTGGGGDVYCLTTCYGGLVRLNNDGTLDTTFGTGGVVTSSAPAGGGVAQPDGKIVTHGSVEADGGYNFAVARYWH